MLLRLQQWQRQAQQQLAAVSQTPDIDARLCLCHVLQVTNSYLYREAERLLTQTEQQTLDEIVRQRISGQPLAYLFGHWSFYDLVLEVAPCTLIPRPDTECLVEQALNVSLPDDARVLDLGTGTGAIALALAKQKPLWQVVAIDAVADAVALAERNRQQHAIDNCTVLQSDWFSALAGQQFELIVSNPPYIDPADPHLAALTFEPLSALVAANHGMADLQKIISTAGQFLTCGGWLWLEHGYDQADAVQHLLQQHGFSKIESKRDYGNNWRLSGGCWQP